MEGQPTALPRMSCLLSLWQLSTANDDFRSRVAALIPSIYGFDARCVGHILLHHQDNRQPPLSAFLIGRPVMDHRARSADQ